MATIFWKSLHQSNCFLGSRGPSKLVIFSLMKYRSRQYYESKVLHNTEVTWFSVTYCSAKIWPIIDSEISFQSTLRNWAFCFKIDYNHIFIRNSNFDCGVNNRPILALKVSKETHWMGLRHFKNVCLKIIASKGT